MYFLFLVIIITDITTILPKAVIAKLNLIRVPLTVVNLCQNQLDEFLSTKTPFEINKPSFIVSDIHGNIPALNMAIDFSRDHDVTTLISLGDMVDFNPYNNEVMNKILEYPGKKCVILGNHDEFVTSFKGEIVTDYFGMPVDPELAQRIRQLPDRDVIKINEKIILVCHSNPWNLHALYISPEDTELQIYFLSGLQYDGYIFGHTHAYDYFTYKNKFSFNPGSLGQSRNNTQELTFAWILPEENKIELYAIYHEITGDTNLKSKVPELIKTYHF